MRPTRVILPALLALAVFLPLAPAAAAAGPYGVHLSVLPEGVAIAWFEQGGSPGAARVEYGPTPDLGSTQAGRVEGQVPPGVTVYAAVIEGLPPGEPFHYRVVSPGGSSDVFTARAPPARDSTLTFVAFGDHGHEKPESALMVAKALERDSDLVVVPGDLSYADGRGYQWDLWFELIEPLAATRPFMVAVGNHEQEDIPIPLLTQYDSRHYEQYAGRFVMPENEFHFSFDAGPVRFVTVNSEDTCITSVVLSQTPYTQSGECRPEIAHANETLVSLLDSMLAEAAASDARWIIVYHHRPVYSHGAYRGNPVIEERWTPLYEKYGVDLVLTAHDHNYQRSYPLRGGSPVDTGPGPYAEGAPVYVVTGGGGDRLYSLSGEPYPAWWATGAQAFHYVHVTADPDRLVLEAVHVETGEILDRFVIGEPEGAPTVQEDPREPASIPGAAAGLLASLIVGVALGLRRRG